MVTPQLLESKLDILRWVWRRVGQTSPPSPRIGISISPLGKIEPALLDDPYKPPDVILVTFEEFEATAQRPKVELLKGTIVPTSEDEIPRLIRDIALKKRDLWPLLIIKQDNSV